MRFRTSSSVHPSEALNHLKSVLPAVQANGRPHLGSLSPGAWPKSSTSLTTGRPTATGRKTPAHRSHARRAARCYSTALREGAEDRMITEKDLRLTSRSASLKVCSEGPSNSLVGTLASALERPIAERDELRVRLAHAPYR